MSYIIVVSNGYVHMIHGPWHNRAIADRTAGRWNRVYERRGWPISASVQPLLDKSAETRDRVGVAMAGMAEQSRRDELLRLDGRPCDCLGLDVDPDSVTDECPDGVCACGHVVDEHAADGSCDAMVVPESARNH